MRARGSWFSVALLVAASLLLAACGGSSSGGDGSGTMAKAEVNAKNKAKALALIDISVADFDGVALNEIIKFEFTERLQSDSVRPDTIQLREGPNFGKQVPGDFRVDGNLVYFYPALPTKPSVPSTIGEVVYAGLKPGTLYQITLPGVPKIAVVRNYMDSPLRKLYRERFQTAMAGTAGMYVDNFLDPLPAKVRFCNPPNNAVGVDTDTDILLTFTRRPLNPATVSRNTVRLTMQNRHGVPNLRSIPGEPVLDQSYDRVVIRFVPDFPLADDATYKMTAERLEDLVGNDVNYFSAIFSVRDEPARYTQFVLTFDEPQKGAYMDDVQTTASWNGSVTSALAALFTAAGGTGVSGDLTPTPGTSIQIDPTTKPGVEVVYQDGVYYDVYNFRRITVPVNTTISFAPRPAGPNRAAIIKSLFPITIDGVLSVRAGNGGNGESTYSTSALPTNPGGTAGPGGAAGGAAYSGTSTGNVTRMDGGSITGGASGGIGGEESGSYYYSWSGGGGGGGSRTNGTDGKGGGYTWGTNYNGAGGKGGLGVVSNLARLPSSGGAGGGGGGMGYYYYYPWRTGAGSGGGGGGAVILQSSANIRVSGTGKVLATGGKGGDIKTANYYGGAGGGGGGGSIRMATTANILIDANAQISVAGGLGGVYGGTYASYTGGQGGNGGEGFICFAVPDRTQATVSNSAVLTYSPPYYDTTFSPAGGGAPSQGQTKWINLGVFDPDMLEHDPFTDLVSQPYNDTIDITVQMVLEDTKNLGNPDLSAINMSDPDGNSLNTTIMSNWTPISQMHTLNGNHYQFIRIRVSFQLDGAQIYTDQLPFVDQLTFKFRY